MRTTHDDRPADLGVAGGQRLFDLHRRRSVRPAGHQHAQGRRDDMAGDPDTPYVSVSEFILGHRRKYFNPVAILLMLSTFYAVVFALVSKEFTLRPGPTPPCSGGLSAPTTTTPRCTPRPTCC
ncbi:MAG: hypothetical protein ACLT1W_16180 [Alistipes onderdonkii]